MGSSMSRVEANVDEGQVATNRAMSAELEDFVDGHNGQQNSRTRIKPFSSAQNCMSRRRQDA